MERVYPTWSEIEGLGSYRGEWYIGAVIRKNDWWTLNGTMFQATVAHTATAENMPVATRAPDRPFEWMGPYNAGTTYGRNQCVLSAEGFACISLVDNNLNNLPSTEGIDTAYWGCYSHPGADGQDGENGQTILDINGLEAKVLADVDDEVAIWSVADSANKKIALADIVALANQMTASGGWTAAGEDWTYASADDPTYTFTIMGDQTTKYQQGDRLKLTQTTEKYFIITAISYTAPNTTVTVYGGTDYDLANAAITDPYYSKLRSPRGFPFDPAKWSVTISDTGNYTQSSPSVYSTTLYNLGSISIVAPLGAWNAKYRVPCYQSNTSNTIASAYTSLSTSASAVSDSRFTDFSRITTPTGANQIFKVFFAEAILTLAAKTTYYLIEGSGVSNGTTLAINGGTVPITIELVSAYL